MAESSSFSNPAELIQSFNDIQNNFGDALNNPVSKTRELAGNMLITLGTPFFAERLKKHIGEDAVNTLQKYAKGEMNLGEVFDMAKSKFESDILPAAKSELFAEVSKYVPGLQNINLENATMSDIRNAFQTQVTQKLKSALPQDLADALPESFTQADIINSVKQMGTNTALAYAKQTLPPDVYAKLESNQDLIRDPTRIATFINDNIADAKANISRIASTTQQNVAAKIADTKQALIDKADQTIGPLREKVANLTNLRQQATDTYNLEKGKIASQYEELKTQAKTFQRENPGFNNDDLAAFRAKRAELVTQKSQLDAQFTASDKDLVTQIDDFKSQVGNNTDLLYNKLNEFKNGIFTKANQVFDEARATGTQALANIQETGTQALTQVTTQAQELGTQAQEITPRLTTRARRLLDPEEQDLMPVRRSRAPIAEFQAGEEQPAGILDTFKQYASKKIKQITEPVTRRAEDVATGGDGYKPRMMAPDEAENAFSERALTFKNPILADYYGTELADPQTLLVEPNRSVVTRGRKIKTPREQPTEEPTMQPRDQLAPMRELQQRNQARTITQINQDPEAQRQLLDMANERPVDDAATAEATPAATPTAEPSAAPISEVTAAPQDAEQAPSSTTVSTTQNLSEPLEEEATQATTDIVATTGENVAKTIGSVASKVGTTLDEVAAATEEIPVLDVIMDVGGLLGSIFGGSSLLSGGAPKLPSLSGASYEPNL